MDRNNNNPTPVSFEEAILKAKVAQICDHVGYHAITQDSSNILADLYRRTIHHLARHCKDAANNNRRTEPTPIDLVQAYNFVGISIPELQEHIETVKIPLSVEIEQDDSDKPPNRIQRNLLVDDLLDAEKTNQDDNDGENCIEEDEKPSIPLLKDTYQELTSKFTNSLPNPVKADKKMRPGRILLLANKLKISPPLPEEPMVEMASTSKPTPPKGPSPKSKVKVKVKVKPTKTKRGPRGGAAGPSKKRLKTAITPLDPSIAEPPSFFPLLEDKLDEAEAEPLPILESVPTPTPPPPPTPIKQTKAKKKEKEKLAKKSVIVTAPTVIQRVPTPTPIVEEPIKSKEKKKKKKSAIKVEDVVEHNISQPVPTPVPTPIPTPIPTPTLAPIKQTKAKKKKKSANQFAIVTETVTATDEKEWLCPGCGGPDDGDLMVECDSCQEWYHLNCTDLKKPPEDDENWECELCIKKAKEALASKRPTTPAVVAKTKTPDPVASTSPIPTPQPVPPAALASGSQDDRCPECHLPDDGTLMIQCDDPFCAKWFHGKCVNLLEEPKDDESWFCKVCVEKQQSAFKRRRRAK